MNRIVVSIYFRLGLQNTRPLFASHESVFDHLSGLALKGLWILSNIYNGTLMKKVNLLKLDLYTDTWYSMSIKSRGNPRKIRFAR